MEVRRQVLVTFFILVFVLFLSSCGGDKGSKVSVLIQNCDQKLEIQEVISPIEWISLSDNVDFVIGRVERMIEYKDEIFILETGYQNCVLVFDDNGNCMRRIGVRGAGVGEYPKALDFALDHNTGDITILSLNSTVYRYDNSGNFLTSSEIEDVPLRNIVHTSYGYVASTNHAASSDASLLYWYDDDFNFIGKAMDICEDQFDVPVFGCMLNTFDGIAYYNDFYFHRIYDCTQYAKCAEVLSYDYPNPMPKNSYEGMTFFEDQTKFDFTNGIVNLGNRTIIKSMMSMRFDVAVVSNQGEIFKQGTLLLPLQIFNGADTTLLSPVSVDEYFQIGKMYSKFKPQNEPSPDDNILILRWRLTE